MLGDVSLLPHHREQEDTREKGDKGLSGSDPAVHGDDMVQILSLDPDLHAGDRSSPGVDEVVSRSLHDRAAHDVGLRDLREILVAECSVHKYLLQRSGSSKRDSAPFKVSANCFSGYFKKMHFASIILLKDTLSRYIYYNWKRYFFRYHNLSLL